MPDFTMDMMSEVMNELLRKSKVQLLVTMPKGTFDVEINDNMGNLSAVQFFIILNAAADVLKRLCKDVDKEENMTEAEVEEMIDKLLAVLKEDVLKGLR